MQILQRLAIDRCEGLKASKPLPSAANGFIVLDLLMLIFQSHIGNISYVFQGKFGLNAAVLQSDDWCYMHSIPDIEIPVSERNVTSDQMRVNPKHWLT